MVVGWECMRQLTCRLACLSHIEMHTMHCTASHITHAPPSHASPPLPLPTQEVDRRLDVVESMVSDAEMRGQLRDVQLRGMPDVERITRKLDRKRATLAGEREGSERGNGYKSGGVGHGCETRLPTFSHPLPLTPPSLHSPPSSNLCQLYCASSLIHSLPLSLTPPHPQISASSTAPVPASP